MRNGDYVDGEKDGPWISYSANGNVASEGSYVQGQKHGFWTLYWPNGNKKSEATFHYGKNTGLYTAYHENGARRVQGRYNELTGKSSDGKKEGVWRDYAEDGETEVRRITYHNGSRACKDQYPPFHDG